MNTRILIFIDQLLRVVGLAAEDRHDAIRVVRELELRRELAAEAIDQLNAFGMGQQGPAARVQIGAPGRGAPKNPGRGRVRIAGIHLALDVT
jgi:hypothetical protein